MAASRAARGVLVLGCIYHIALNAAFIAVTADMPVMRPQVLEAIRIELSKDERLLNETSFLWPGANV